MKRSRAGFGSLWDWEAFVSFHKMEKPKRCGGPHLSKRVISKLRMIKNIGVEPAMESKRTSERSFYVRQLNLL